MRTVGPFKRLFYEVLQAVIPITVLVIFLQVTVLSLPAAVLARFLVGALMVTLGQDRPPVPEEVH